MRRLATTAMYLGTVATVLCLSKIHAAVVADPPYDFTAMSTQVWWSAVYAGLICVVAYALGLPDLPRQARSAVTSSLVAPALAALVFSAAQLLVGQLLLPRFVVFGAVVLLPAGFLVTAAIASGGRIRDQERDRVLLVSTLGEAHDLTGQLASSAERPAQIVASVSPQAVHDASDGDLLCEIAVHQRVSVVVLDRVAQHDDLVVAQAARLHEGGVRVRTLTLFYEEWLGKVPLSELERTSMLFDIGELHRQRFSRVKRVVDVTIAFGGLLPLVLAVPLVAFGNLFGNRGPLFFRQERIGRGGATFDILKFRTMSPSRDGARSEWTRDDDPRVTRFGRVLRRTHVDELPQVVNILRGDLSMVGPRPEQPHYVEQLRQKLPFYDHRLLVRPGLTGWAQVKQGYAGDLGDSLEKLQYEFFYLRHQDVMLDLRILGRTLRSVAGRDGR